MYSQEAQAIIRLAKDYNLIPVTRQLMADTETPIRVFQHFHEEKRAFLLESVEGGVKWARYSFIGTDPFLMLTTKGGVSRIETAEGTEVSYEKPLDLLKARLRAYRSPALADLPRFTGGAVGFFGYDLLQYYEKLSSHRVDDLHMNDIQFMFCDQVIVFDHFKQQIQVIGNVHIPANATDSQIVQAYERTCKRIEATVDRLTKPLPPQTMRNTPIPEDVELGEVCSNVSKEKNL